MSSPSGSPDQPRLTRFAGCREAAVPVGAAAFVVFGRARNFRDVLNLRGIRGPGGEVVRIAEVVHDARRGGRARNFRDVRNLRGIRGPGGEVVRIAEVVHGARRGGRARNFRDVRNLRGIRGPGGEVVHIAEVVRIAEVVHDVA